MKDIQENGYTLENKIYEATLSIFRADIEDDNLGVYRAMADEVTAFFNREIAALLKGGFTANGYDGKPFFSAEHPVNNKRDGSGEDEDVSNIIGSDEATGKPWFLLSFYR